MLKVVKSSYHGDNLFLFESIDTSEKKPPTLVSLDARNRGCKDDSFPSFTLGLLLLLILPSSDASERRSPMLISDINPIGCVPDVFTELGYGPLILPCIDISDRRPPILKLVKLSSQGIDECNRTTSVGSSA
ncbi:hypothetical protein CASFOL_042744 [Castilleja foliolosa]|uniref:Uncharacterized protein n=1 Tax=Castilleja foliolosa TaxID=1961234 RepID=A0ABD3B8M2_9LAMI